jgi:hypothetical protein
VTGRELKTLDPNTDGDGGRLQWASTERSPRDGTLISKALLDDPEMAVESFGHVGYKRLIDGYSEPFVRSAAGLSAASRPSRRVDSSLDAATRARPPSAATFDIRPPPPHKNLCGRGAARDGRHA